LKPRAYAVTTVAVPVDVERMRMLLHRRAVCHERAFWRDLLVPLRDMLLALQWLVAVFGSQVMWRGVRVPLGNSMSTPVRDSSRGMADVTETLD
jgi:ceramide glucosyltransferase